MQLVPQKLVAAPSESPGGKNEVGNKEEKPFDTTANSREQGPCLSLAVVGWAPPTTIGAAIVRHILPSPFGIGRALPAILWFKVFCTTDYLWLFGNSIGGQCPPYLLLRRPSESAAKSPVLLPLFPPPGNYCRKHAKSNT